MSFGKQFVHAMCVGGDVPELLSFGNIDHLFKDNEVPYYAYLREHVKKFHVIPDLDTLEAHVGEEVLPSKEPAAYYIDLLKRRYVERELKTMFKKASDLLTGTKDPEKALELVMATGMELVTREYQHLVTDFRSAYELIIGDYATKWNAPDEYGLKFGWPTLDEMSGGLVKGDMISIVGRPAMGKTWQMLYAAMHGWLASNRAIAKGKDVPTQSRLFVSMEMKPLPIQQRLASMLSHLAIKDIDTADLSTTYLNKLKKDLLAVKGFAAPFYVVDGNLTATVEDIWALARQLQVDGIFIDGGYLLKHPRERDRFKRVAENAELIKSDLCDLAPTAVSWQFSRTGSKKQLKKGETSRLDGIGYTDAIGQVSSLALGLFQGDSV